MMFRVILLFLLIAGTACAPVEKRDDDRLIVSEKLMWPSPPQKPRIQYLYSFSEPLDLDIRPGLIERFLEIFTGDSRRGMLRPYGVAADDDMIVIADPGLKALHIYSTKKKKYKEVSFIEGKRLVSPVGVVLGPDRIYVSDSELGNIFVLDRQGKSLNRIEGLTRPTGIALHQESGTLYIAETTEHRVVVYNTEGRRISSFGSRGSLDGEFNFPSQLALYGNTLYVNDTMNYRVQVFTLDGQYISSFGELGDGSGQFAHSKGLGTDSEGHLYIADGLSNHVQIFDSGGRFLLSFGGMGTRAGQFILPEGLYIANNKIYVVDSFNRRVQVFEFLGGDT